MDRNASGDDSDIDWDTEDELEIQNFPSSSRSSVPNNGEGAVANDAEASTSRDPSVPDFVGMGFSEKLVAKAIKANGDGTPESILETLLTYSRSKTLSPTGRMDMPPENDDSIYSELSLKELLAEAILSAIENSSDQEANVEEQQQNQPTPTSDNSSSDYNESLLCDLSDSDGWLEEEETTESSSEKVPSLAEMGYTMEEISIAVERCGPHASIDELSDFMCAAQMARAADIYFDGVSEQKPKLKKRLYESEMLKRKRPRMLGGEDGEMLRLPNPMIGFGVPSEPSIRFRPLPEAAIGPPYFYYENVALAPKGVWDTIKRFLYDVEPEFVDSKYFCAAARKRGYVHNLPIENRFPLLPLPPRTIHEALPMTKRWWPSWDTRTKLNCLQTCIGSAKLTERIRKSLEDWGDGEPPLRVQKYVLDECRKWNLVWVGRNKVAPLECDEVEMLLGFPRNHTRGGGISRTDRYKSLGNSFQVDTVAYHLSVLRDMFPGGINMLSLFSGIGGAEVALHRLGIPLKIVVSVEKSEVNRNIVQSWWEQTNQKGKLIHFDDVQQLNGDRLEQIISSYGGFDLVVGGSPCNNLAGSNRHHRDGLEGKESSLFYDYFRILDLVRCIMGKQI